MASGDRIRCFFLEPTGFARRFLRRYVPAAADRPCPLVYGYHDADVLIDVVASGAVSGDLHPHDDPRWPSRCACGHAFEPGDEWQLFHRDLYARRDTGEQTTLSEAPHGAMWYADWFSDYKGPDGHTLVVKTPGGDWIVDMPPGGKGRPWTRTGAPPDVTATPSIAIGRDPPGDGPWKYHGWLRDGYLVEC